MRVTTNRVEFFADIAAKKLTIIEGATNDNAAGNNIVTVHPSSRELGFRTPTQLLQDLEAVSIHTTITAGDGLLGGGSLESDITLEVDNTVVRTTGSQTIGGAKTFTNAVILNTQATNSNHAVRADRTIATENGIEGGGNLTSNRTIGISVQGVGTRELADSGVTKDKLDPSYEETIVRTVGTQSIDGEKTFTTLPKVPTTNPTSTAQVVSKRYLDAYAAPIGHSHLLEDLGGKLKKSQIENLDIEQINNLSLTLDGKATKLTIPQNTVPFRSSANVGEPNTYRAVTTAATADTIAMRTSSGRLKAADPNVNDDVTTKRYVDVELGKKVSRSEKGEAGGYVPLDSNSKIPNQYFPQFALNNTYVATSEAEQLNLPASLGDLCVRSDLNKNFIHNGGTSGDMSDWTELASPDIPVRSVNGEIGDVVITPAKLDVPTNGELDVALLGKSDVGHGHSISDVSNLQTELNSKVNNTGDEEIAGVKTFTSIPVLPNSSPSSTNHAVRKKYVDDQISSVDTGVMKVNGHSGPEVTLDADDVGARNASWIPTPTDLNISGDEKIPLATNNQWVSSGLKVSTNATVDTIVKRKTSGRVTVGTPTSEGDATTKKYVDDLAEEGKAVWGNVKGTLSDQTDLHTALGLKADDADVVKLSGNQSIAGTKTFTSRIHLPATLPSSPTHAANKSYVDDLDNENVKLTGTQSISGAKTFTDDSLSHVSPSGNVRFTVGDRTNTGRTAFMLDAVAAVKGISIFPEGRSAATHRHTLTAVPNSANQTHTLPNKTGTIAHTSDLPTTPAEVGAAPAQHTHDADDITTGTLSLSRIPTGTSSNTVALGNHTHADYIQRAGDAMDGDLDMQGNEIIIGDFKIFYNSATDSLDFGAV